MLHRWLVASSLVLFGVALAHADSATPIRPFPLTQTVTGPDFARFEFSPQEHAALRSLRSVRFTSVELPTFGAVDLELQRVRLLADADSVFVDGVHEPSEALSELTLWEGRVAGRADSAVYLGLSRFGSRGFVRVGERMWQLDAAPGPDRDWSRSYSILRLDDGTLPPAALTGAPFCGGALPRPTQPKVGKAPSGVAALTTSVVPIYKARIAIETDEWFYYLFGNLSAAQNYYFQLMGAISNRYREQIGVIFDLVYSGFHTSADPWVSGDTGAGSLAMLFEFQAAWQNGAGPVTADLYHFISGANLGGGVAYLPGLCDPQYGFGCSGNIGGNTPLPVTVGPLNWDFMVVAHELGHNFGAPHTHDYCPPADECAPGGYFGACQGQQNCTSSGTIMSYCHLCSGGLSNITTYFHPLSVTDCRNLVLGGCLPLYEGITYSSNLGFALPGSNGSPALAVGYDVPSHTISFDVASAPASKPGLLFISTSATYTPLFAGTLVPSIQVLVPVATNGSGALTLAAPIAPGSASIPGGATLYAQGWFADSTGLFAATHGAEFELILP